MYTKKEVTILKSCNDNQELDEMSPTTEQNFHRNVTHLVPERMTEHVLSMAWGPRFFRDSSEFRIGIIDDDPFLLEIERELCRNVLTTGNSEKLKFIPYLFPRDIGLFKKGYTLLNLLISDHDMPIMCGSDVIAFVRSNQSKLPICILSADFDLSKINQDTFTCCLEKPLTSGKLDLILKPIVPNQPQPVMSPTKIGPSNF